MGKNQQKLDVDWTKVLFELDEHPEVDHSKKPMAVHGQGTPPEAPSPRLRSRRWRQHLLSGSRHGHGHVIQWDIQKDMW